jgi:6-phosphogluconolactonase
MKANSFSRRSLLMGAATLSVSRLNAADQYPHPMTEQTADLRRPVFHAAERSVAGNPAVITPPYAYVGCYTGGSNARGISVFHYDPTTNELTLVGILAPVSSPSFIVLDATKKFLYSGNESGTGSASAFAINSDTGALRLLNTVGAGGQPAHVAILPGGKYLLTANYTGGTVAVFPIQADGSLGTSPQIISHFGNLGPNTGRQEAPHPHMVLPDSTGRWVLVNDLGLDTTFVYSFDATTGNLTEVSRTAAAPGSGPRHLAWHPNGRFVYSINELANTLNTYLWNGNGNLIPMQENLSTLPAGFKGNSGAGEVLVDAAGKYLYASNRGDDNILICSIDQATFQLTVIGSVHTQGRTPRHFNFDPTGNFIHVGNQDSANIVTFKVDKATGALTPAGLYTSTPAPACIQFA